MKTNVKDPDKKDDQKPKKNPQYSIILFNDDDHTGVYVVELLVKVYRHQLKKAIELTNNIDQKGQSLVWVGSKELGELKIEQTKNFGNDPYGENLVKYPMICSLEPLS